MLSDDKARRTYDSVGHSTFEAAGGAEGAGGAGGGFPGGGFPGGFPGGFSSGGFSTTDASQFEDILSQFFGGGRPSRDLSAAVGLELAEVASGCTRTLKVHGRDVSFTIPPGVESGTTLRVPGAGLPAQGKQPAGSLLVSVSIRDHPRFTRDGPHLHVDASIGVDTAALGGAVRVPVLSGETEIKVPAGTQPGDTLRLRGRGLPRLGDPKATGDQFVRLHVAVPRQLTPKQRELLEQFGEEERAKRGGAQRADRPARAAAPAAEAAAPAAAAEESAKRTDAA